jgi:hypothetical protein
LGRQEPGTALGGVQEDSLGNYRVKKYTGAGAVCPIVGVRGYCGVREGLTCRGTGDGLAALASPGHVYVQGLGRVHG